MSKSRLEELLVQLKLKNTGTVFFRNEKDEFVDALGIDDSQKIELHFDIQKKLDLIRPAAIYVFNKHPFILFFDLTDEIDKKREDDIHKKVWSFDNSPVIFVIKNKDISVYNALNYIKKDNCLEKFDLSENDRNEQFSFWNLQSGETWRWIQKERFENSRKKETQKRVNEKLFQNIKQVRERLTELNIAENHANSLILRLIFIRYLIDRKVEINKDYILGETINDKRKCFCKLITQPERLNGLFEYLNKRFNGVLFKDLDVLLNEEQSVFLAKVFSGELQENDSLFEGYFFEIFDFSIIPVELISGIYESLIDDETKELNSAVYTPPFLVDYILNDTVDKYLENPQTSDCKIFEVAVGSGIFLVQSLRRMIEKEKDLNKNATNEEFSKKIRAIVKDNLFGIDINEEALKVTCFSIYIALLDYQEPKDIKEYKFPTLYDKENIFDSNLFCANFFDTEHDYNKIIKDKKPTFILGNPPWKNGSKDPIHVKYLKENNLENIVSDYQLAQSFLLRTKDFSESRPICSLIVTSKVFYNNNATSFKEKFLNDFYLKKCLDLSCVRQLIFEKANNPATILQYQYANGENTLNNIVSHSSLKYNFFIKNYKMLTFEKNDFKEIKQEYFIKYKWMFKVALYGDVLDFVLLSKVPKLPFSIETYLENNNIHSGNGIKRGGDKAEKKHFDSLIGLPILEMTGIKEYYTPILDTLTTLKKQDVFLESGRRNIDLFKGKRILFGKRTKNESDINISLVEKDCVFRDSMNAMSFNTDNETQINVIYSILISDLFIYYQYLTSSNWGIYYPEIHKTEFLSFPFIEPNEETKSQLIDLVNQFLQPLQEHWKQDTRSESLPINEKIFFKINSIINDLYGINGYEKDLIDYVLNVSRYQFQESKQDFLEFTSKKEHYRDKEFVLKNYVDVYLQEFGKIYDDEFMKVEIYPLKHFIAMNFKFSDTKLEKQIDYPKNKKEAEVLKLLSNKLSVSQITNTTDPTKNLFIQKDIKGFEENSFYIIKPNEYKCWHRAMAWYDVAEFMERIEVAELKRFNQIEE